MSLARDLLGPDCAEDLATGRGFASGVRFARLLADIYADVHPDRAIVEATNILSVLPAHPDVEKAKAELLRAVRRNDERKSKRTPDPSRGTP